MNHLERVCPQCAAAVEGRANKIFCSAACRAQNFRDLQDDLGENPEELERDEDLLPTPHSTPVSLPPNGEACPAEHWLVEYERKQKANQLANLCDRLHQDYSSAITSCLQQDGESFDKWDLGSWIREIDLLSMQYRKHPRMREPGNRVPDRLEDIYWLYDKLRRLLANLQTPPEPGVKKPGSITFEVSAKRRARLRANLLPD
jgi:hypothetical protein